MNVAHSGVHTSRQVFIGLLHHVSRLTSKTFFENRRPECPVISVKCTTATVAASATDILENISMVLKKIALSLLAGVAFGATAQAADIDHVLLISVDGLHALDVARYVESHPNSALAELSSHGITYTNARTPALSDSFPGLLALVTGGSPISHGLFYDVSYDRTLFDPSNVSCKGAAGNTIVFDESIDKYNAANVSLDVIDPDAAAAQAQRIRPMRSGVSARRDQDQHDLRSGQEQGRTYRMGGQAPGLRPRQRPVGQGRR